MSQFGVYSQELGLALVGRVGARTVLLVRGVRIGLVLLATRIHFQGLLLEFALEAVPPLTSLFFALFLLLVVEPLLQGLLQLRLLAQDALAAKINRQAISGRQLSKQMSNTPFGEELWQRQDKKGAWCARLTLSD